MTRLIDADAFKIIKVKTKVNGKTVFAEMMQKVLDTAPTVDAEPVRHGKWVIEDGHVCCSECGEISKEFNYCPYCGARMDEE